MSYHLIGADGQEYGPVEADVVRQWIAERRANAQSRIRESGSASWGTLGELPEFAAALESQSVGAPQPPLPKSAIPPLVSRAAAPGVASESLRAAALDQVRAPALFLLVVAACGLILETGGLVNLATFQWQPFGEARWFRWQQGLGLAVQIPAILFSVCLFGLAVFAGVSMLNLRRWGLCVAGAIVMIVPCTDCCCCLGLASGVWSLIVLTRPDVRKAFES